MKDGFFRSSFRIRVYKVFTLTILVSFLFLCACSESRVQEPVEITLMHGWGGNLNTHRLMQEIYAEFDAQNPDIEFNAVAYADSAIVVEKANDMLAVGKMPDIVSTNGYGFYVMNAAKRNMALDLMPFIEADESLKEQIHPAVLEVWQTGTGKLYTVPDALEMAGFWYNRALFEEAGIVMPASTWTEFFEKTQALADYLAQSNKDVSICCLEKNQLEEFLFLARLAGEQEAGLRLAENAYAGFDKKTLMPVMKDLEMLMNLSVNVDTIETARQKFGNGQSALYFNGVWESEFLAESEHVDDFAYAAYPTASGKTLAYTSPSSGYVFAKQDDPRKEEATLRFLKYMLSDEVQKKIATTGQAPSNPKISVDEIEKEKPLLANGIRVVRDADIQISTIRSVWPENKFLLIAKALEKRQFSDEDIDALVSKWQRE